MGGKPGWSRRPRTRGARKEGQGGGFFSLSLSSTRSSALCCALLSKVSSSSSPLPSRGPLCLSTALVDAFPAPSCPFTSLSAPSSVDGTRRRWLGGWAEAARDPDRWAWKATIVASTEAGGQPRQYTTLPSDWFLGNAMQIHTVIMPRLLGLSDSNSLKDVSNGTHRGLPILIKAT